MNIANFKKGLDAIVGIATIVSTAIGGVAWIKERKDAKKQQQEDFLANAVPNDSLPDDDGIIKKVEESK
jgi:hypothetical protein